MSDSSAGHCAKHRKYRCDHCETLYEDSYHDDWDEVVRDQEKRIEELEADKQRLWDSIEAGESVYKRKYEALRVANDVCTLHCMEITEHLDQLREAADRVAFEAEADDWSCMPSIQACKKLAAALEGE